MHLSGRWRLSRPCLQLVGARLWLSIQGPTGCQPSLVRCMPAAHTHTVVGNRPSFGDALFRSMVGYQLCPACCALVVQMQQCIVLPTAREGSSMMAMVVRLVASHLATVQRIRSVLPQLLKRVRLVRALTDPHFDTALLACAGNRRPLTALLV